MTFQVEEKFQLAQFYPRFSFAYKNSASIPSVWRSLLHPSPHHSRPQFADHDRLHNRISTQISNSNFETTIFTKPKPSLYRHPKKPPFQHQSTHHFRSKFAIHARTRTHTHIKHNFAPDDILAPESLLPRSSRSPSHCRSEVKIAVWHQPTNLGHHKITYPIKKPCML